MTESLESIAANYSSSDDDERTAYASRRGEGKGGPGADATTATRPTLVLPSPQLDGLFATSAYAATTERAMAAARCNAADNPFIRAFQHERGNYASFVFIPVPNTPLFRRICEESTAHLETRIRRCTLNSAPQREVEESRSDGAERASNRSSSDHRKSPRGKKRPRPADGSESNGAGTSNSNRGGRRKKWDGVDVGGVLIPHAVGSDQSEEYSHLSVSRTFVLRPHQLEPFRRAFQTAVQGMKSFSLSVSPQYRVFVNEESTRSFLSLDVDGGAAHVEKLVRRVDALMARFSLPSYYENAVPHVSIASTVGDLIAHGIGADGEDEEEEEEEEEEEGEGNGKSTFTPSRAAPAVAGCCVRVEVTEIMCKIGGSLCRAPLGH